ncbi:MAG: nucleoside kinase, partial [Lachnospiraceae bacterium]|nr:nucleoside kinase [Lachnospiraceae bacterium]
MPTIMIGGTKTQYEKGVSYETIAKDFQHKYKNRIALVYFNRKMRELNRKVTGDGVLTFITTGESSGFKAYSRTASMMLVKALSNIMGERSRDVRLKFEFSLGNASYCTVIGDVNVDDQLADQLTEEMKRLRDRNIPIIKKTYPIDDAIELFRRQGMKDKEKLFQYRRSSTINVYNMDGYYDYFYGYMLPSTGYVELFRVQAYEGGLLLVLPTQDNPNELEEWHEQKSLFDQLIMGTRWGDLVDISTVGDLNEQICAGNISDMILVQEALQERRIGDIAEMIHERSSVKIVMVAGPSSSGKTTFAHRLAIQLRSFGMKPHIISMDNYFVNREKTPLDADGNYNFECLEALDLELFEDDMCDLLEGEEIEMPTFDFRSGRRVYKGNTMQLGPQDVLIIEGIHGLNPRTTQELPQEAIFKVYISA